MRTLDEEHTTLIRLASPLGTVAVHVTAYNANHCLVSISNESQGMLISAKGGKGFYCLASTCLKPSLSRPSIFAAHSMEVHTCSGFPHVPP